MQKSLFQIEQQSVGENPETGEWTLHSEQTYPSLASANGQKGFLSARFGTTLRFRIKEIKPVQFAESPARKRLAAVLAKKPQFQDSPLAVALRKHKPEARPVARVWLFTHRSDDETLALIDRQFAAHDETLAAAA